jgi:hypothetical protein
MNLREIKKSVLTLSPKKLQKLNNWIHELLNAAETKKRALATAKRRAVGRRRTPHKTYRLQWVRCGNKKCRCASGGSLHGPYWYAYWVEEGRLKSQYIGKKLPRGVKAPKESGKRRVR